MSFEPNINEDKSYEVNLSDTKPNINSADTPELKIGRKIQSRNPMLILEKNDSDFLRKSRTQTAYFRAPEANDNFRKQEPTNSSKDGPLEAFEND